MKVIYVIISLVFWDKKSCSPLKVNRRFGGTCRLHFQGQSISQAGNNHEAGNKQNSKNALAKVKFDPYAEKIEILQVSQESGTMSVA
jgi:hypothetical protein